MKDRIYKGYWWLPDCPENQVAGFLTIECNGKIVLELLGVLGKTEHKIDFDESQEVISGRCYAPNNNMKDISLMKCYSAVTLNFSSSFPIVRYVCSYALLGIHLDSMESSSFFEANVAFDNLADWCPPDNVKTVICNDSVALTLDRSYGDAAVVDSVKLDDGTQLDLVKGVSFRPDHYKVFIEQSTYLRIQMENMSCYDALSKIGRFEEFLAVASLSYTVEHGKITLYSKECYQSLENGEHFYHPIELVTHLYKNDRIPEHRAFNALFSYEDISSKFSDVMKRYYENKDIIQIWSNLLDSIEVKRVYSSNDFLVVVQAIDGFAIRFRKEDKFMSQLKALRDEFQNIDKVRLTDNELHAIRGSRDYYTHILKLAKKTKRKALDGSELYYLTRKLRVLLICCVLNFLGFDNDAINRLFRKCNSSILQIRG